MLTYAMGAAIRSMRIRAGYTQEELSFGICSVSTLSRIENGRENVSRRIFEALTSRMMGENLFLVSFESGEEMECARLYRRILFLLEQRKPEEVEKCMKEYQRLIGKGDNLYTQFVLFVQTVIRANLKDSQNEIMDEIIDELFKALNLTIPEFHKAFLNLGKYQTLLTYNEIFILNHIGIQYSKMEDDLSAMEIFCYLKRYTDQKDKDVLDITPIHVMVLSNLAQVLEKLRQFREAARLCDTGIESCGKMGRHTVLPYLLCTKSRCLAATGNYETAKSCKMLAKAILDIEGNYKGYGDFSQFYEAKEPIYVTL